MASSAKFFCVASAAFTGVGLLACCITGRRSACALFILVLRSGNHQSFSSSCILICIEVGLAVFAVVVCSHTGLQFVLSMNCFFLCNQLAIVVAGSSDSYFLSLIDCPLLCEVCSVSDLTGNQAAGLVSHGGSIDSYSFSLFALTNASCGAFAVIFSPSVGCVTEAMLMSSLNDLTATGTDIVFTQSMASIAFANQSVSQDVIILVGNRHVCYHCGTSLRSQRVHNIHFSCQQIGGANLNSCIVDSFNQFAVNKELCCNRVINIQCCVGFCAVVVIELNANPNLVVYNQVFNIDTFFQYSSVRCCAGSCISVSKMYISALRSIQANSNAGSSSTTAGSIQSIYNLENLASANITSVGSIKRATCKCIQASHFDVNNHIFINIRYQRITYAVIDISRSAGSTIVVS